VWGGKKKVGGRRRGGKVRRDRGNGRGGLGGVKYGKWVRGRKGEGGVGGGKRKEERRWGRGVRDRREGGGRGR